ncbi:MAG: TonB-dependent receptor [Vicinamibacteria bacterium]
MKHLARGWAALAALLLATSPLYAQTTGRITGKIIDTSGGALPGVVITVTSPNLQGAQSTTTNSDGEFRLLALPPGTYDVKAELAGFRTLDRKNVLVGIDRTVAIDLQMGVAPVAEVVTVTGEAPVIDVTSATSGVNATEDLFTRLPVQRDFYSIARVAPGTQDDGIGTVFYGSSGAENQYIIEGLNTTGVEVGDKGKTLNFDFVQEIEIKSGGLPAEYGRATGGVVNVVTKSGGNEFTGSVFGFYEGGSLQSDNKTGPERPAWTTTVRDTDYKWDFGANLGGYLVKDKVWFFGAYNRVQEQDNYSIVRQLTAPGSPAIGSEIPAKTTRDLYAAKLTYRLTGNHTLTASLFGDPSERDTAGTVFAISGPASTWQGTNKLGGTNLAARYDGVFAGNLMIRGLYGRHREKSEIIGAGRDTAQNLDLTVTPTAISGGFGFFQDQPEVARDVYKLDISKFAGKHELKLGGDIEDVSIFNNNYNGGAGQRIYKLTSAGTIYYRHRFYVDDRASGYDRNNPASWTLAVPLSSEPNTLNTSVYLQDSWRLSNSFTLNAGVRWERQQVKNRDGDTAIDLDANWAPRFGLIWDVTGDGKSKLYANYGRFFESVPMDINIRAFGGEVQCFCYNFSPDPNNYLQDPAAPRRQSLLGGAEPVDPELKGQYLDEVLGGFEYEIAPNLALGAKVTYRKLGRVIEDFLVDPAEGTYAIANLGEGTLGQTVFFYDYVTEAPAPKAERENWSVELTARRRFANGWQMLASYVWSKLEGNYDGTFQNSTGQLDPNINSAFDYADFLVNSTGSLSAERKHQVKFDGSYELQSGAMKGLNFGLSAFWYSGLPLNAYGYSFAYQNWEYYLAPRGSLGRGPSDYETDIHLSYPIKVGERARLNVLMDVFNLFDRQAATQLDERYNLAAHGSCAGIPAALCNGDGGLIAAPNTVNAAGQIPNIVASSPNPDFHQKGVGFTLPRSIRFGVRLTF